MFNRVKNNKKGKKGKILNIFYPMGSIDFIDVLAFYGKKAKNFSSYYKKKFKYFFFIGLKEKKIF